MAAVPMTPELLLVPAAYLLGGVPAGYLIAKRAKGIDIRGEGSGNPGAANVYHVVGKAAGAATLAVDALKGWLPVTLARTLEPEDPSLMLLCGGAAIVGHVWTVFLCFRGGKGVATSAGVFAAVLPLPTAVAVAVFVVVTALSRHISAGSIAASALFPFFALGAPRPVLAFCTAACALILYKHIPNIRYLLTGEKLVPRNKDLEKQRKMQ